MWVINWFKYINLNQLSGWCETKIKKEIIGPSKTHARADFYYKYLIC